MYLKALELSGFKSFADKTIVEFNRGITSIVGPNGSGKSNILDAILWVLGEQSYKNIRAKESSDIIFSGGKNKKAKSMAEVSLIVDNEDKYLDIEFSEVKITRRIYKSGENEYFINNRRVRLKDINNLFMDTGIGKQAYSIIGQGRVERIISSTPKELREILEEAAGVKRAKIEKDSSEKKLNEVKNEVEKIDYVEKELEKRVSYLKEESLKARLFKTYTEKINVQKFMVLEYNIVEKENKEKEYKEIQLKIQENINNIQKNFDEKQEKLKYFNENREEKYLELEKKKIETQNLFNEIENLKNEYSKITNRYSNLEIEANEKAKRKNAIEEDINEKKKILNNSKKILDKMIEEFKSIEKERNKINSKVENLKSAKEILQSKLRKNTQKSHDYEVDKIKALGENDDIEKRVLSAENENKRRNIEKQEIEKEFENIKNSKTKFDSKKIENENNKKKIENELNNYKQAFDILVDKKQKLNKEKTSLNYNYENLNARKRANENIIEKNETFAKSIKYILNEKIDGVVGAFVNLIEIPNGYEEAIQVLSGGSFQDIVVENTDVAKKGISILKEKKIGRASFLPLDGVKVFKLNEKLPTEKGVIGFARNIVKYDKSIEKIINFVYGNSLIVENLEIGTKLLQQGYNDRIVTLEGDIITSRGRMTGGHLNRGKDELLERKKELTQINEKLKEIRSKIDEINFETENIDREIENEEKKLEEEKIKFDSINKDYNEFLLEYDTFNTNYNKKKRELETLNYEISENEKFIETRKKKIEENKEIIKNIEKLIDENKVQIISINDELEEMEDVTIYMQEANEIDKEYEILKVKTDNNKLRHSEIEKDFNKLINEKNEIDKFEERKNLIKIELEEKIIIKKEEIENKNVENSNLKEEINSLEKNIKELEANEREFIKEIKDIEVEMVNKKNEHEKIVEKLAKNSKDLEYFSSEIEMIETDNIKESEEYKKLENETDLQAIKRKLITNEKNKSEIGSVNLLSIEEYERENERYIEITSQKKDLIDSRESLLKLIRDIEEEIVQKFSVAFEQINKNFEYMCKTILNGAKGVVKLIDAENLLETGLELSVKYKNKPEQTLLLLSGGEKSMLAVSFIMAIFMFKPSPFTFFDEIEAALDEENTKKIVQLLNGFIEKSQFILITHNKETMKGSHRLYGVTMNKEIGESRIISVDV